MVFLIQNTQNRDARAINLKLDVIGVYDRKHPKADAVTLEGGKDDKMFRLDRVDAAECAELTGHQEVASLQRK